ncbi:MAG: HAD hydrolase-like protein [Bacteroidota bacterium]|nr:HAD hydrolase-like protein [Bacteroidota bacterium]
MKDADYTIFDFDGTIDDTLELGLEVFNRIAPEYNLLPAGQEERELFRTLKPRDLLKNFGISKLKLLTLTLRIRREMDLHVPEMKLFGGMGTALNEIRNSGFRIGIITSNSAVNIRAFLEVNQMGHIIDFIYSGRSLFGKDKIIRKMLLQEQIEPGRVIYAGDEIRDIEAYRAAGIPVIAVSWGLNRRELLASHSPDQIEDTPADLPSYVSKVRRIMQEKRI